MDVANNDIYKAKKFIEQIQLIHQTVQEQLENIQGKYKARHDKHRVERLQGEGKKLKPIRYGPFKILEKVGNNAFKIDLPSYMQTYSIVNV